MISDESIPASSLSRAISNFSMIYSSKVIVHCPNAGNFTGNYGILKMDMSMNKGF